MSRGLNVVHLIGNVGKDPEVKTTGGGVMIATVSLATTSGRKDRDGNTQESTEWHRLKFFGKLAEIVQTYVEKGNQLYVQGRVHYDEYEKNGEKRYMTEIICDEMQMLGGRPEREAPRQSAPRREAPKPNPAPTAQGDFNDDFADDDIPF